MNNLAKVRPMMTTPHGRGARTSSEGRAVKGKAKGNVALTTFPR